MRENKSFGAGIAIVAAICAAVDACALMVIAMAPETAGVCGASWILPGIGLILIVTYGVPLVVAGAVGIALSARFPFFRAPKRWMVWSLALCALAAIIVIGAGAAHPVGTDPIGCAI